MKKIFSFLVVCLLSSMAMGVWAQQDLPAKFSSADGSNENWYNISFNRYYSQGKYWLVDHDISGALINRVLDENGRKFQWKFVLVDSVKQPNKFYMVNREYGEYVSYMNPRNQNFITDSYGMLVPPRLEDPITGECTVKNWDGACRWYVDDSDVYYMDAYTKDLPSVFEFRWSSGQSGWGIIDVNQTEVWPNTGEVKCALNDWSESKRIIAVWVANDAGSIVNIERAGVPVLTVSTENLPMSSLLNFPSQSTFTVGGRLLNGNISITKEGPDESAFTVSPTTLLQSAGGGTVTVTFTPTALRDYEATIRISSPDAEDMLVKVTGEVFQQSDLPKISEGTNNYWYYIQFTRPLGRGDNIVLAKNDDDSDPTVMERPWNTGAQDPKQMWKIGGDWTNGYYLVNKANGEELLYNTKNVISDPSSLSIISTVDRDRYILVSDYGNTFNFERFRTTNNWQLYNRDITAVDVVDGVAQFVEGRRYVNEWDFIGNRVHHWFKNDDGNEMLFIPADKPLIRPNPAFGAVIAQVGETNSTTINVIGLGTSGDINVSLDGTGKDAFMLSTTSLPPEGGEIVIFFTCNSETEFSSASLVLSSAGADDVIVPLTGSYGGPIFSTPTQDVWCYIQFQRAVAKGRVWQNNGLEKKISQTAMVAGDYKQQWKLEGTEDAFIIQNRADGGFFVFQKATSGTYAGTVTTAERAIMTDKEDDAEPFAAVFNGSEWWFKLLLEGQPTNRIAVNDEGNRQNEISVWSNPDSGNPVRIIPVEKKDANKKGITYVATTTNLVTYNSGTATAKVNVSGNKLTGNITAALTGSDADKFTLSPSTLPAAGGELTITFSPTAAQQAYSASLILSSADVKNVTLPFTGMKSPRTSVPWNTVWYYIQFERTANKTDVNVNTNVWQWNGPEYEMSQAPKEDGFEAQHWKFVGDIKSEFIIENRMGGQIAFDKTENDATLQIEPTGNPLIRDEGDPMLLKQNGTKWELQLAKFTTFQHSYMNDARDLGIEIGRWIAGDGGNFVKFFVVNEDAETGIKGPSIDTDDKLVSVKYYNLQGIEITNPPAQGVYIVKKIYASGKIQAAKQLRLAK